MTSAKEIAIALDAKPCGNGYRAKCPAHKDKSPSLWFSDAGGKLHFQCKAGCHYLNVRAALGLSGKVVVDNPTVAEPDPLKESLRRGKIRSAWDNAVPIEMNSPAWKYLTQTRKVIPELARIPVVLRETPSLKYYDHNGEYIDTYPAMLARLDTPDGSIATIHRTYLTLDGTKAPVDKAKKLMVSPTSGITDGGAIRLFELSESGIQGDTILGIAEGIETALACYTLHKVPTWAAWSSTGMARLVVPEIITDLFIFADNDTAGMKAAGELVQRLRAERPKLIVRLITPKQKGHDFADELTASRR